MSFKLGYFLVEQKIVSLEEVDRAFKRQLALGGTLDTNLLELGLISLDLLESAFDEVYSHHFEWILGDFFPTKEMIAQIPLSLVRQFQVVPMKKSHSHLEILVSNAGAPIESLPLSYWLGIPLNARYVPQIRLFQALEAIYSFPLPHRLKSLSDRLHLDSLFTKTLEKRSDTRHSPLSVIPQVVDDISIEHDILPSLEDRTIETVDSSSLTSASDEKNQQEDIEIAELKEESHVTKIVAEERTQLSKTLSSQSEKNLDLEQSNISPKITVKDEQ